MFILGMADTLFLAYVHQTEINIVTPVAD